jgi:hypothetical protein
MFVLKGHDVFDTVQMLVWHNTFVKQESAFQKKVSAML